MAETDFEEGGSSWDSEASLNQARFIVRYDRLEFLGLIALAVFAIASDLGLSIAVVVSCLSVGWDQYCLVKWLRQTDPDRIRGRTTSLFYFSWGIWKIILVAFGLFLVLGFTAADLEIRVPKSNRPPPLPSYAMTAFLIMFAGFFLQGLVAILAVWSAIRYPLRIWVGPELGWARRAGVWPPQAVQPRAVTENRARIIIISALISLLAIGLVFLMIVAILTVRWMISENFALAAMGIYLVLGVFLFRVLLDVLEGRMIADTVEECWTDAPAIDPRGS